MADNANATAGDGSVIIAADDIAGVKYVREKLVWGVDGTAVDASASNPLPVSQTGTVTVTAADLSTIVTLLGSTVPTQVWKSFSVTTTQTGAAVWTPSSGKKIVVTHLTLGSKGTTSGDVILWFGAGGGSPDTSYTEGTDQPVFKGSFAPSSSALPGVVLPMAFPIKSGNADYVLRLTTSAGISLEGVIYGWEE